VSRAAVVATYDAPIEVEELPVPDLAAGSLLVRMVRGSVCGSDVHFWHGKLAETVEIDLPTVPGHEGVGEIVGFGTGDHVDSCGAPLRVGDRVIWAHAPCRRCRMCTVEEEPALCESILIGYLRNCRRPPYLLGTFSEYAYISPNAGRILVPEDVESDWATAASCALRTVVHAFDRLGPIDSGSSIVVQGTGTVGLFAVAMAAVHSPRRLVAIGAPDSRLRLAREWGATDTISIEEYTDPRERLEAVRSATGGRGADIVMEMSGAPGAFAEGIQIAGPAGRYLVVGTLGGAPQPVLAQFVTTKALRIIGSFSGQAGAYYRALEFMRGHRRTFDWSAILGNTYTLTELEPALAAAASGDEIKPLIDPLS
jgi:threonine dehydrogenase-like Zn-dependent dehydrogenase